MRRAVRSLSARGAHTERRESGEREDSIDALAAEVVERVVRVLVRRGVSRGTIERSLSRAWRRIPKSAYASGTGTQRELIDISHVLTVWFVDPLYVDADGEPLRLSVAGPAPSLATLVQHVDPKLDVRLVLKYLLKFAAVRRVGRRYAPRSRALALRGMSAEAGITDMVIARTVICPLPETLLSATDVAVTVTFSSLTGGVGGAL